MFFNLFQVISFHLQQLQQLQQALISNYEDENQELEIRKSFDVVNRIPAEASSVLGFLVEASPTFLLSMSNFSKKEKFYWKNVEWCQYQQTKNNL